MSHFTTRWISFFALTLLFSANAFADLDQTSMLASGAAINLDTGATNSPPNDLLWNGTTLTPQGSAVAYTFPGSFDETAAASIPSTTIEGLSFLMSNAALTPSAGDLIAVRTNSSHYSRVLVKTKSAGSITLVITTFGVTGGGGGGAPTITAVLNNSSNIPAGLPNSGLTPSSIIQIRGSNLADEAPLVLQDTTQPGGIPRALNGAVITVTVGSFTQDIPIYYTSPAQLAAVLPAATPVGNGTVTVKHNGVASNAFAIQVVTAAPGITTYNGNTGVVQDSVSPTGALITATNSAKVGQYLTIWGNGFGASPQDSDTSYTGTPHQVSTSMQVYLGGTLAPIAYQGATVYPGVGIVVITVPNNAPEGCWVSISIVANGVVSNSATIPLRAGGGNCVDAVTGLNPSQLSGGSGTLRTGVIGVSQSNTTSGNLPIIQNVASAIFTSASGTYASNNSNQASPGTCVINVYGTPSGTNNSLIPGTITLTGPNGLNTQLETQFGSQIRYALLSENGIPASGGTFNFAHAGSSDVGPFNVSVNFTAPLFVWTNKAMVAGINRSQNQTVNWTGGTPGSWVLITGQSGTTPTVGFSCISPVAPGTFTIPAYILSALPGGTGGMNVSNYNYVLFTATGLDIALATATVAFSETATFQ